MFVFYRKKCDAQDLHLSIRLQRQKCRRDRHRAAIPLNRLAVDSRDCFLVGNEGRGLPEELIDAASDCVLIPMREGTESLNAAAAAAILIWETGKGSWIK